MSPVTQGPLMTDAMLKEALSAIRKRIEEAEHEQSDIQHKLTIDRQEERLLLQLLEVRGGHSRKAHKDRGEGQRMSRRAQIVKARSAHPLIMAVAEELAIAGRPIHISDLMRVLHDKGISVPGSGTQANLISYLRREPQFVRTSRGMYGLAAWGLENMPTIPKEKRRRVRFGNPKGDDNQ
jgi:hypothetical protein